MEYNAYDIDWVFILRSSDGAPSMFALQTDDGLRKREDVQARGDEKTSTNSDKELHWKHEDVCIAEARQMSR